MCPLQSLRLSHVLLYACERGNTVMIMDIIKGFLSPNSTDEDAEQDGNANPQHHVQRQMMPNQWMDPYAPMEMQPFPSFGPNGPQTRQQQNTQPDEETSTKKGLFSFFEKARSGLGNFQGKAQNSLQKNKIPNQPARQMQPTRPNGMQNQQMNPYGMMPPHEPYPRNPYGAQQQHPMTYGMQSSRQPHMRYPQALRPMQQNRQQLHHPTQNMRKPGSGPHYFN